MIFRASLALALSLSALSSSAFAADAAAPAGLKTGAWVWSSDGRRIGRIDRINGETVAIISNSRMVYVPVATIAAAEKGLTSSLTRQEIEKQ